MRRLRRIRDEVGPLPLGEAVGGVVRGYRDHDLLTYASAIAFQVLFSIIPLTLFGLGVLGGLGLQEHWSQEWAPKVRPSMSASAFGVVDDTVRRVLGQAQLFWTTAGAAIAIWKISAAMRGIMDVFDRIYDCDRERTGIERIRVSVLLGMAVAALLLGAAGCALLGDDLLRGAGLDSPFVTWLRWPVSLALLLAVVALLVARAPVDPQPPGWVTFGSLIVVVAWVGTSLVLGWYLTSVADYGSVFGALATVVIVLTYLYVAAAAVLTGAEVDALVRDRVENGG